MFSNADIMDLALILAGLAVWGTALFFYLRQTASPEIVPPRPQAVGFGSEWILIAVLVFLLVGSLTVEALKIFGETKVPLVSRQILGDFVGKLVLTALLAVLFAKKLPQNEFFPQATPLDLKKVLIYSFIIYLAIYPLVNVLLLSAGLYFFSFLENWLGVFVPQTHQAFEFLNDPHNPAVIRTLAIILAALVSPVAEEFFFRGLVQNVLYRATRRPWLAVVLSGALFGLVHVPLYAQVPALWALGVILGWSYYRFGRLGVPILIHILFNAATLLLWSLGGV